MTATEACSTRHAPFGLLPGAATGSLGPAASIAVAVHARHCVPCAAQLAALEALGGALLEEEGDAAFDVESSLAAVMARFDHRVPEPTFPAEVMAAPLELRPAYAKALARGRWAFAGPGLRSLALDLPGASRFAEQPQLLKIEPGFGAPRHSHGAMELTLVIEGAFRDHTGVYGPGDLAVATNGLTHRPIAEPGQTCLAFAVSHASMRFTGLLGMAQRLLTPGKQ